MPTQSMFFPLINAPLFDVRHVVVWRGQIAVNSRRMMQNAGPKSKAFRVKPVFCRLISLLMQPGVQSGRNITVPSKYFNRQGKHLPDTSAGQQRGVRQVEAGDAEGQRIDNFLLGEMSGVPRSRVYGMLRKGEVRVNGGRIKPDYRLKAADIVRIPPWRGPVAGQVARPGRALLDELASRILYQDAGVIVVDKPAGTAVHGGSGIEHGVIEAFRVLFPDEKGLELAHRLDRDTSGCLVLARNRKALLELHTAFRDAVVAKTYDVLVYGAWPKKLRTVRAHLENSLPRRASGAYAYCPTGNPRGRSSSSSKAASARAGSRRIRIQDAHIRSGCIVRCRGIRSSGTKSMRRRNSSPRVGFWRVRRLVPAREFRDVADRRPHAPLRCGVARRFYGCLATSWWLRPALVRRRLRR